MTVAGITVTGAAHASHRLLVAGQEAGMLAGRVDGGVLLSRCRCHFKLKEPQPEVSLS